MIITEEWINNGWNNNKWSLLIDIIRCDEQLMTMIENDLDDGYLIYETIDKLKSMGLKLELTSDNYRILSNTIFDEFNYIINGLISELKNNDYKIKINKSYGYEEDLNSYK